MNFRDQLFSLLIIDSFNCPNIRAIVSFATECSKQKYFGSIHTIFWRSLNNELELERQELTNIFREIKGKSQRWKNK